MSSPLLRIASKVKDSKTLTILAVIAVLLFINVILSGIVWGSADKLDKSTKQRDIKKSGQGLLVTTLLIAGMVAYLIRENMM